MAMLSARFDDNAAAERAVRTLVDEMGATANLVIATPETPLYDGSDAGARHATTTTSSNMAVRVAIHDNAISPEAARRVFEAAGGIDIKPVQ